MRWARAALLVAVCVVAPAVRAAEAPPVAVAPTDPAAAADAATLDAIRAEIVALDIEKAIAAVDSFLARSELPDHARADALDLRAQANVANDDLDAAERDFRAILVLRPEYVPNSELMSKRGMERFARVAASTIGTIHLDVTPQDVSLTVDGRPVVRTTAGSFKSVAGERRLHVERKGFDAVDLPVRTVAGAETLLKVVLVPNARHLVVHTDVAGVAVTVDGVSAGETSRGANESLAPSGPAELLIEDVPIGERVIRLQKACYATETLQEIVRVDIADRSPEQLRLVTMRPAQARVTVTGTAYNGELRVDGASIASLPVETFTTCPGRRLLEVVTSGRAVWSGAVDAGETDITLDLSPRPNCSLIGAAWPKAWAAAASAWSIRGRLDPPAAADLSTAAGWASVSLPAATDVALGVIPGGGVAGEDRVLLFSPALGVVEDRPLPPRVGRPAWRVASIGVDFVDAAGGVIAAVVSQGGPGARAGVVPGDRVFSAGGRRIVRAADAADAVSAAAIGSKLTLEIAPPNGPRRFVEVDTVELPRVLGTLGDGESRVVRAAWGAADGAAGGAEAQAALANLATLLERAGREGPALEAWRKVRATASAGSGLVARADYALGVALSTGATPADAADVFTRAKAEADAAGDAALSAAAADRLADLGIVAR